MFLYYIFNSIYYLLCLYITYFIICFYIIYFISGYNFIVFKHCIKKYGPTRKYPLCGVKSSLLVVPLIYFLYKYTPILFLYVILINELFKYIMFYSVLFVLVIKFFNTVNWLFIFQKNTFYFYIIWQYLKNLCFVGSIRVQWIKNFVSNCLSF